MQFGEPGGWSLILLGIAVGKRHPWRTAVPCARGGFSVRGWRWLRS